MDHAEITQKDSIESMESGYGSFGSSNTKCDICDAFCPETIVVSSPKQITESDTNSSRSGTGNTLFSIGYFCHGCFTDGSPTMAAKMKEKLRFQAYTSTSVNMSSEVNAEDVDITKYKRKIPFRHRLTRCEKILLVLLVLVLILFIIVLLAILVSTDTLRKLNSGTSEKEGAQSASMVQNESVDCLKTKYQTLLEKMEKLESIMDNFENQTIKRQNSVDRTLADHTMKLLELTHNLNKTKGTSQFNLDSDTQCNYYKPRQRTSAAISETRTPWYPTEDDSDVVITGVDCSVDGGISSQLETRQNDGLTQYSCVCPAQSASDNVIHTCTIHVWSCSNSQL